jgi:hypothetical protein
VCGIAVFFAPWLEMTLPTEASISGFDLARHRAPWYWGGAVGWLVLLAVVGTRRTIAEMRGIRVLAVTFPAMSLLEALVLIWARPGEGRLLPVEFAFAWGLYATAVCALVGIGVGARLGGRVDDVRLPPPANASSIAESSDGETLH